MENLGQVPSGGKQLSTFSSASENIFAAETVRYPFRKKIQIKVNTDLAQGFTALVLLIDSDLVSEFLMGFEYYTYENLVLDLQCTSSLTLGSGAMLFAYSTDPSNANVPTDYDVACEKYGNTDGFVIIRPRDSKSLQIPVDVSPMLGGWRYVKATGDSRLETFGAVVGLTLVPPASGDGTAYEGWLHGYAVGKRRTVQTTTNIYFHHKQIISAEVGLSSEPSADFLQFEIVFNASGNGQANFLTMILDDIETIDYMFIFTDEDDKQVKKLFRITIDAHPCIPSRIRPTIEIDFPTVPATWTWLEADKANFALILNERLKNKAFTYSHDTIKSRVATEPAFRAASVAPLAARSVTRKTTTIAPDCVISGRSNHQFNNLITHQFNKN